MDPQFFPDNATVGVNPLPDLDSDIFDVSTLSTFEEIPINEDSHFPPPFDDSLDGLMSFPKQQAVSTSHLTIETTPTALLDGNVLAQGLPELNSTKFEITELDTLDFDLSLLVHTTEELEGIEQGLSNLAPDQIAFLPASHPVNFPIPRTQSLQCPPLEGLNTCSISSSLADMTQHAYPATNSWTGAMASSKLPMTQDQRPLFQPRTTKHRLLLPADDERAGTWPQKPESLSQPRKDDKGLIDRPIHHKISKDKNGVQFITFGIQTRAPKRPATEIESENRRKVRKAGGQCLLCRVYRRMCKLNPGENEICDLCKVNPLQNSMDLGFRACLRDHPNKFNPFTLDGTYKSFQEKYLHLPGRQITRHPPELKYLCFGDMFRPGEDIFRTHLGLFLPFMEALIDPTPSIFPTPNTTAAFSLFARTTTALLNQLHFAKVLMISPLDIRLADVTSCASIVLFEYLEVSLRRSGYTNGERLAELRLVLIVSSLLYNSIRSLEFSTYWQGAEEEKAAVAASKAYLQTYFFHMWPRLGKMDKDLKLYSCSALSVFSIFMDAFNKLRSATRIKGDALTHVQEIEPHPPTISQLRRASTGEYGKLVQPLLYSLLWKVIPFPVAKILDLTIHDFVALGLLDDPSPKLFDFDSCEQFWLHWDVQRVILRGLIWSFLCGHRKIIAHMEKKPTESLLSLCKEFEVIRELWLGSYIQGAEPAAFTISEKSKSSFRVIMLVCLSEVGLIGNLPRIAYGLGKSDTLAARFELGWQLVGELVEILWFDDRAEMQGSRGSAGNENTDEEDCLSEDGLADEVACSDEGDHLSEESPSGEDRFSDEVDFPSEEALSGQDAYSDDHIHSWADVVAFMEKSWRK